MRAILINPHTTSVSEVEIEDSLESWYRTMSFNEFKIDIVQPVRYDKRHSIWVDEEGLLKAGNRSFELSGIYPEPLFGCALIIGEKQNGDSCNCSILLTDVQSRIVFGRYLVRAA